MNDLFIQVSTRGGMLQITATVFSITEPLSHSESYSACGPIERPAYVFAQLEVYLKPYTVRRAWSFDTESVIRHLAMSGRPAPWGDVRLLCGHSVFAMARVKRAYGPNLVLPDKATFLDLAAAARVLLI